VKRTPSLIIVLTLTLCTSLLGCAKTQAIPTGEAATEAPAAVATSASVLDAGQYGAAPRQWVETLTKIGPRVAGTDGSTQAEQSIEQAFKQFSYQTEVQPFTATSDDGQSIQSANVVATKPGASSQVIVVGAHYDGVDAGLAADDNASGVAVLLFTASILKNADTPCTIEFVAFGAEEAGLLGSQAFVSSMSTAETGNVVLFVNMDSVIAGDITYIYGPENQAKARDWAMAWAGANGYDLQTIENVNLSENGEPTADYAAFEAAGIPWIYFEATNWTLGKQDGYTQVDPKYGDQGAIIHTQYDNLQYLDETFPGRVDAHLDLYVNVLYHILTEYRP
jgi:alkaline phosphatase isozyme conversion protein